MQSFVNNSTMKKICQYLDFALQCSNMLQDYRAKDIMRRHRNSRL